MTNDRPVLGFVGLGTMGTAVSKNLLDAGYDLVVNDLRDERIEALEAYGARSAATPREVAERADTVFSFLPRPADVREVALGDDGIAHATSEVAYVDMSTIGSSAIREIGGELEGCGIPTLGAPVGGSAEMARSASLRVLVGGDEELVEAHREIFETIGQTVTHLGPLGSGQTAKLCNNMLLGAILSSLSEVLVLAERAGLDRDRLLEAIGGSPEDMWSVGGVGSSMVAHEFEPGFPAAYHHKDLQLAVEFARDVGAPLPVTKTTTELYETLERHGRGDRDCTAVLTVLEGMAGADDA